MQQNMYNTIQYMNQCNLKCPRCQKMLEGYRCPACNLFLLEDSTIKKGKKSLYHQAVSKDNAHQWMIVLALLILFGGFIALIAHFTMM